MTGPRLLVRTPSRLHFGLLGWVPTVSLDMHLRALPRGGWLKAVQRSQLIADNWLDETCDLYDETDSFEEVYARIVAPAPPWRTTRGQAACQTGHRHRSRLPEAAPLPRPPEWPPVLPVLPVVPPWFTTAAGVDGAVAGSWRSAAISFNSR